MMYNSQVTALFVTCKRYELKDTKLAALENQGGGRNERKNRLAAKARRKLADIISNFRPGSKLPVARENNVLKRVKEVCVGALYCV